MSEGKHCHQMFPIFLFSSGKVIITITPTLPLPQGGEVEWMLLYKIGNICTAMHDLGISSGIGNVAGDEIFRVRLYD
ncbi:MAG: hypothetical protein AB1611_11770 [bacterium]